MKINPAASAMIGSRAKPASPFILPKPMPGVVPDGAKMAMDDAFGGALDYGAGYGGFGGVNEGLVFLGYPYLSELAQRAEYRMMSETIAKEMTRKWIKVHAKGDEDKSERIAAINDAMDKFRVQDVMREAVEHDGFFGKGQIYIDTGAGDKPDELLTPLTISKNKIPKGGLRGLRVIEPMWTYPGGYDSTNPLSAAYYKPQFWYVMSKQVHHSRLLQLVSREVPDILKPAYMFGGLSMSQMAKPYVDNWLRVRQSVSDMIDAFSVMVLETDLGADLMSGGDGSHTVNRAMMFNQARDNRGLQMVQKDTEALTNVSAPLGGLDHLQAQAQEHMASVSGIPLVKLTGITPSGLNASSEGEIRVWYDRVLAMQEHLFTTPLRRIIDIIQLSEFGDVDPDITFSYEPLFEPTEMERSTIRKANADTAAVYIEAGVISTEDERSRLAAEDNGQYDNLDLSEVLEPPVAEMEDPAEVPDDKHLLTAGLRGA